MDGWILYGKNDTKQKKQKKKKKKKRGKKRKEKQEKGKERERERERERVGNKEDMLIGTEKQIVQCVCDWKKCYRESVIAKEKTKNGRKEQVLYLNLKEKKRKKGHSRT